MNPQVVIVGAGLAGLACARELQHLGISFLILEADSRPGGRQKTRVADGFRLDEGFQVVLSSYHALQRLLPSGSIKPRRFDSGAWLHDGKQMRYLGNPLERPASLFSRALPLADQFRLALLSMRLLATPDAALLARCATSSDVATAEFLSLQGFSRTFFEKFARPFFGGVLLDRSLETSAGLFCYYLKKFLTGHAWIPARGIQRLPEELARPLPSPSLRFNECVEGLRPGGRNQPAVLTRSGGVFQASCVVLALDAPSLHRLAGSGPCPSGRAVTVVYLEASRPLYREKCLVLPEGASRVVRHFVQISNIDPETAPDGRFLVSATVLEPGNLDHEGLSAAAVSEIASLFPGSPVKPLAVMDVPYAVPLQPPGFAAKRPPVLPPGFLACGDWQRGACIENALSSGLEAARQAASHVHGIS